MQTTTAGVTAAALAIFLVARSEHPAACGGTLITGGAAIALSDTDRLAEMAGRSVEGTNLPVESVPAGEGFWLGCADGRVWIQLLGEGESEQRITSGQRLGFDGIVVSHAVDFPTTVGVDQSEGAQELDRQRVHLEVRYSDVRQQ